MTEPNDDHSEAKFRESFEKRIKEQTLETLPAFITEMLSTPMDYGTICLASAFAAAATAWAIQNSPQGGITGFQAGCIGWEFLSQWGAPELGKCGARILKYDDLLYPQYERKFSSITPATLESIRKAAAKNLEGLEDGDGFVSDSVVAHWKSIVAGKVPFGLEVADA